jgi:hypothetical protein
MEAERIYIDGFDVLRGVEFDIDAWGRVTIKTADATYITHLSKCIIKLKS